MFVTSTTHTGDANPVNWSRANTVVAWVVDKEGPDYGRKERILERQDKWRHVMLNGRLKTYFNPKPLPQTSGGEGIMRVWNFSASLPNFYEISYAPCATRGHHNVIILNFTL